MYMQKIEILTETGVSLAALAIKGTAYAINTKIKAMKDEKNVDNVRNNYNEIINELISEREEAIRIAQVYKSEIEKIEINEKDLKHLHNTATRVLDILKVMDPKAPVDTFAQFQELIDIDTLKAMQLLGFNYKAAIGEPLTELCANAILSKGKSQNKSGANTGKIK